MRVTKLIREYVEKVVCEKMPMPEQIPDPIKAEHAALLEELTQHCRDAMAEFTKKHGGKFGFCFSGYDMEDIDAQIRFASHNIETRGCTSIFTNSEHEYNAKCKEIRAARAKAINDILVTLELGGNKADLDAMLANL